MTNLFTERYGKLTNSELLEIISNPTAYQPLAVETAKMEFESRHLTEGQIADANSENELLRQEKLKQKEKVVAFQEKTKSIGAKLIDGIDPTKNRTDERLIKIICAVFAIIWLYNLIIDFQLLKEMLTDIRPKDVYDSSFYLFLMPFILIPTATILFWLKKKFGWTLLSIFLTYSAVNAVGEFIMALNRHSSGIPALDNIFPQTSTTTYIWTFLFFAGALATICTEGIREIYSIDKKKMAKTISVGVIITLVILFEILM